MKYSTVDVDPRFHGDVVQNGDGAGSGHDDDIGVDDAAFDAVVNLDGHLRR